jgi:hypothetical protein
MDAFEAAKAIRKLRGRQRESLDQIGAGGDGRGFGRKTLEALERKGLIEGREAVLPGRFPVRIKVYEMPLVAHMAWCALCAGEDEDWQ